MLKAFVCFPFFFSFAFSQYFEYKEFVEVMCSDSLHGRGYVNQGDKLASSYIAKQFEAIGLKEVFEDYYQYFPMSVNTFPDSCSIYVDNAILKPGVDFVVSPESGTAEGEFTIVQFAKHTFLEEPSDLKNKILELGEDKIILINKSDFSALEYQKLKTLFPSILNYAPILEMVNEKFTWSVSRSANLFPHILIKENKIDLSSRPTIRLIVQNKFFPRYLSQNVVGTLPATKKTKKTVFITAHYDHLGRMGEYCLFPGANDNASGNAMMLALAEQLKKKKSRKYNYLFVSFGGEEAGLIGSAYMSQNLPIEQKDIHFLLNLDIFGSGETGITVVNSTLFKREFKVLLRSNRKTKSMDQIKERGPAANSDHYFFTQLGIPSFFIYTEGLNKNYHDVNDTYENLSFAKFEALIKLLERFVTRV